MAVQTFRDDDPGYEAWFAAHPSGWVVNAKRSPSPAYLKLHRADCPRITRLQAGYQRWTTGDYIKVCAEHRAELDAGARQALRAGLQGGCHCVQYRDGARPRTTSRVPTLARAVTTVPAAAAAAAVVDAEGYRTLETAGLISFEPRDATLLDSRAALRAMLGGLSARPGEVLHGIVEGPAVAGTDLDNALLYNVGGSVNAAARYGVVIERRPPRGASTATRYRYRLTNDPDLPALDGESVVELDGVVLSGAPRAWPDIWVAVRTSDAVRISGSAAIGELGLRLRVGAPRFRARQTASSSRRSPTGS
jgi:hypothetical protein